jgi:orotate phosphoribosyltransferase
MATPFNLFQTLTRLDGYYECPKDAQGRRLGPLVGYTARDERKRQLVGDVYLNFSCLEESPLDLRAAAKTLAEMIIARGIKMDAIAAMPMGALSLGVMLAEEMSASGKTCRYLFAEKDLVASKEVGGKSESKLIFGRHVPKEGERVLILEDVGNNFSTVREAITLIEAAGAKVVGIACAFNRSPDIKDELIVNQTSLPLVELARKVFPSYRQDDPEVVADIAAGNVVLSTKKEWAKLKTAMQSSL